jgi:sec-independent protein translocase protein TatC
MSLLPHILPKLADTPMTLGDHLHELRRRVVWPALVLALSFIVGVAFQAELKLLLVRPLHQAIVMVGDESAKKIGLSAESNRLLQAFDLGESTMLSFSVAFDAALILTLPVLLYSLWRFVAVGLKDRERHLGFLFIPLGVIFFYIGGLLGYFYGLPYFYAWLIEWQIADPVANNMFLGMAKYHGFFITMTICFGLVMDIPWLVLVLVRVRLVTPAQLAKYRKVIIAVNVILAAMITPTSDPATLAAMFVPMQLLFELGLLGARLMMRREARRVASNAAPVAGANQESHVG